MLATTAQRYQKKSDSHQSDGFGFRNGVARAAAICTATEMTFVERRAVLEGDVRDSGERKADRKCSELDRYRVLGDLLVSIAELPLRTLSPADVSPYCGPSGPSGLGGPDRFGPGNRSPTPKTPSQARIGNAVVRAVLRQEVLVGVLAADDSPGRADRDAVQEGRAIRDHGVPAQRRAWAADVEEEARQEIRGHEGVGHARVRQNDIRLVGDPIDIAGSLAESVPEEPLNAIGTAPAPKAVRRAATPTNLENILLAMHSSGSFSAFVGR